MRFASPVLVLVLVPLALHSVVTVIQVGLLVVSAAVLATGILLATN